MTPEILQKYFPRRKAIIVLEIAQRCRVEVLKLSCMAQKLYLFWDQKENGPQRIAHVDYVTRMYKTLDLCKLPVRTHFVL